MVFKFQLFVIHLKNQNNQTKKHTQMKRLLKHTLTIFFIITGINTLIAQNQYNGTINLTANTADTANNVKSTIRDIENNDIVFFDTLHSELVSESLPYFQSADAEINLA